jgi:hypothetical protein
MAESNLDAAFEDAVAKVPQSEVAHVLSDAATLLEQDPSLAALRAITNACDVIAGPGVGSVELLQASLDTVCRSAYGPDARCGLGNRSVSRWERQTDRADVVATLRKPVA